jgi:hypothetical protein
MNSFDSLQDEINFIQKIFPKDFYEKFINNNSFTLKKFENIIFTPNLKTLSFKNEIKQIELENQLYLYINILNNIQSNTYADMNFSTNTIKINSISSLLYNIKVLVTDIKNIISEKLLTSSHTFNIWLDSSNMNQQLSFISVTGNNYNIQLKEIIYNKIINTCKEYPNSAFKTISNILTHFPINLKNDFSYFIETCILNNPYLINEIYKSDTWFHQLFDLHGIIDYFHDYNLKQIISKKEFKSAYRYSIDKKDLINTLLLEHFSIDELLKLPHGTLTKESWEIIKLRTI